MKRDVDVIDVDADPRDVNHYLPIDKRAYNNGLDTSYVSKLQNKVPIKNEATLSSASLDREHVVDNHSSISNSTLDQTEDLPTIENKHELVRECLRLLKKKTRNIQKIRKLMLLLNANWVRKGIEYDIYCFLASISKDAPHSGLEVADTILAMLEMME